MNENLKKNLKEEKDTALIFEIFEIGKNPIFCSIQSKNKV